MLLPAVLREKVTYTYGNTDYIYNTEEQGETHRCLTGQ